MLQLPAFEQLNSDVGFVYYLQALFRVTNSQDEEKFDLDHLVMLNKVASRVSVPFELQVPETLTQFVEDILSDWRSSNFFQTIEGCGALPILCDIIGSYVPLATVLDSRAKNKDG